MVKTSNNPISALDLRPRLGRRSNRKTADRFLLVCFFDPSGIATIYENIALWQQFSRYGIEILNLWPSRGSALAIPGNADLNDYSGLIVHCTVSYNPDNLFSLDTEVAEPLERYDGVKVLMKQDEHFRTNRVAQFIGQKEFDLVMTCVSPEERNKVYPPEVVGGAMFFHTLTGYVSPYVRSLAFRPVAERPFDITYRGSIQPLSFGRLGFEKRKIGYDVSGVAANYPLKVSISSSRVDRIGGTAWFDFLSRSKAVLGVESATNLFDFTGEVESWCFGFERDHPTSDNLSEEFYNEAHRAYLHLFEGNVNYAQISPRHFEAAATRSAQVLYDGYYSGIFIPNRHFIPLRRDLKNFDEVVDFIADDRKTSEIVNCAFEEIILNRQFHYENLVEQLDEVLAQALARKGRKASGASVAVNSASDRRALLLAAHEPTIDPRIEWMAEGLSADFAVCELGTVTDTSDASIPSCEQLSNRRARVRVGRYRHDWDILPDVLSMGTQSSIGFQHLMLLHVLAELPVKALERSIGALDAAERELDRFRWNARYFVHTNCALLQAARLIGEFDAIVAADLETLPAALVLAEESGATVLYDAHEFWPHSAIEFRHWEVEFWSAFDRNLAARADLRSTVSPQLAALLSKEYGCEFLSVPNCASKLSVPAVDIEEALQRLPARDNIVFIFVGRFAAGRGLEDLIRAWGRVDKRARLVLQGPDDPFKLEMMDLARSCGLLENGITFPKAVDTSELVNASRQGDVAIIPYAASSVNNRYCSPNKLSQYMAAGLPIICNNELEFVKSVVVGNGIGIAVDFRDHQALAEVVNRLLTSTDEIGEMALRSRRFFDSDFNWEMVSGDVYARLRAAVADKASAARADLDFSWIEDGREMRRPAAVIGDAASPCSEVTRAAYAEIKRLNEVYPAEIKRLNEAYSTEIKQLYGIIGFMRIARGPARIALRQVRRVMRLLTMRRV